LAATPARSALSIGSIALRAIGILDTRAPGILDTRSPGVSGYSFLIVISAEFTPSSSASASR
jgi:hypothetical protein